MNINEHLVKKLIEKGVVFDIGLSENEIIILKDKNDIDFPNEYESFIKHAMPISYNAALKFTNWRDLISKDGKNLFEFSVEGIFFDIVHSNFWYKSWGDMPESVNERLKIANLFFEKLNFKMIPIYSHRYVPGLKGQGYPVFSVHQSDVICYGNTFYGYLEKEFGIKLSKDFQQDKEVNKVPFWSDLTDYSDSWEID